MGCRGPWEGGVGGNKGLATEWKNFRTRLESSHFTRASSHEYIYKYRYIVDIKWNKHTATH